MNNEPAFPHSRLGSDADGMTLRDYFAAKAMQELLLMDETLPVEEIAKWAYVMADAMMKVRKQ